MNVVVVGTGYVGLIQGVGLAELGHFVVCIDIDQAKVDLLRAGKSPIYEPGLDELLHKNQHNKHLKFDTDLGAHLDQAEIVFIAVGTPSDEQGRANLVHVMSVAEQIGQHLTHPIVVVTKSTVPIGTNRLIRETIQQFSKSPCPVISNPEFLREGSAVDDFFHPDRIVIGGDDQKALDKVTELYSSLKSPIVTTSLETAELIKYASNAYLATQISFINSVAQVAEAVGADVAEVAEGMRLDQRIGKKAFLHAGLGYGGSCFPKDVRALISIAADQGISFDILKHVEKVNTEQRTRFVSKIKKHLNAVKKPKIAVWGVSFKPETDDVREAPSLHIIPALLQMGASVHAFDPIVDIAAVPELKGTHAMSDLYEVCRDADALIILTEWDHFKQADMQKAAKLMKTPLVFDSRNVYTPSHMRDLGITYISVGRPIVNKS